MWASHDPTLAIRLELSAAGYNPVTMFKLQTIGVVLTFSVSVWAQAPQVSKEVQSVYPDSYALYLDLHEHPELSSHETQTAAKLAAKLRSLGYEVT